MIKDTRGKGGRGAGGISVDFYNKILKFLAKMLKPKLSVM